MAPSKSSSSDNDGLDWLGGGGEEQPKKGAPAGKGKPVAKGGKAPAASEEVLDWLASEGQGDRTVTSPQGAGAKAAGGADLGWLGEGDEAAPALIHDDENESPGEGAGSESMFSAALDDFFDSIDAKDEVA